MRVAGRLARLEQRLPPPSAAELERQRRWEKILNRLSRLLARLGRS